mmetsp:Transcript_17340/g.26179  ORF Transcript_17340/g.26179 Transcript_17340/m.26179 type:complete len:130 (-) Transcript_17340:287-676(-)
MQPSDSYSLLFPQLRSYYKSQIDYNSGATYKQKIKQYNMMNGDNNMSGEEWWRDSNASLMSITDEDEDEDDDSRSKPIEGRQDDQVRASFSGETSEIEIITRRWSYCFIGILGEQISDALACFDGKKTI